MWILFSTHFAFGQSGIVLKLGPALVGDINLASVEKDAFHQKAYHVGLNARIGPYGLYLSPGIHYYGVNIDSTQAFNFFENQAKYHIIKVPLNLGYKMFITRKIKFRIEAGADVNYVLLIDDHPYANYETVNDVYFGLNMGLGFDFAKITLDLSYESGLTNTLVTKDTKTNYLSFSLGYFF